MCYMSHYYSVLSLSVASLIYRFPMYPFYIFSYRVACFSLICKELVLLMNTQYRCGTLALLGPTNAGKSSLLNALLGEKISIVTPKVNTTRSQITGIYTDDTVQIIFLDTP